jgi:3'-5' exonuclease
VHAGRVEEVRNYCLCDVVQTAGVFLRTQLVRGELDSSQYQQAMAGLLRAALNDRRLDPVSAAWNESRLLLGKALSDFPPSVAESATGGARC